MTCSNGTTYDTAPLRLSLQGTRHHLINFVPQFLSVASSKLYRVYRTLLKIIVHKTVPERPDRVEPRVLKRRPKAYAHMTKPRRLLREKLVAA